MSIKNLIQAQGWFAGYSNDEDDPGLSIPLICWAVVFDKVKQADSIHGFVLDDNNDIVMAKEYKPEELSFDTYYFDNMMDVSIKNIDNAEMVLEMGDEPIGVDDEEDDDGPSRLN